MKSISTKLSGVRNESGQILPWAAFLMVLMMGIAAFVVDVGRGYIAYQQLKASTNAAALAAGYSLPNANYNCVALRYSSSQNSNSASTSSNYCGTGAASVYTGANVQGNLQNVVTTVTSRCSSTVVGDGVPCQAIGTGTATANVVLVTQTAQVPMTFARLIGYNMLNIGATAAASARGATAESWNIAVIVDTTESMTTPDTGCGTVPGVSGTPTRLQCALYGVQELLGALYPCPTTYTTCSSSPSASDRVSLWTFPSVTTSTVADDTNCSGTNPSIAPYTFPSSTPTSTNYDALPYTGSLSKGGSGTYNMTYAITTNGSTTSSEPSYLTNYRTSDTSTSLTTSSAVVDAVGGKSGCPAVQAPGGEGTYYAAALYAAQASLLAEQAALKSAGQTSSNAIILLSDGDASSSQTQMVNSATEAGSGNLYATNSGSYPSWVNECSQAIQASQAITNQGTTIYTVAYGSETTPCSTDTSGTYANILPCTAMEYMASSHWANPPTDADFYVDANQSGTNIDKNCKSATNGGLAGLAAIMQAIGDGFTSSRLITYSVYSD